jgi:hypothetical protein
MATREGVPEPDMSDHQRSRDRIIQMEHPVRYGKPTPATAKANIR